MAEVKRRNGIPAMPLKNPPSFNHTSSSYKHIYDDVFASPLQSRQQQSSAFIEDDYAEMFGASRSNNGTWSISYSSIPVLDLPPPTEMRVRGASGVTTVSGDRGGGGGGGNLDYSGVFGGFGDGNFGLPDGEELFDQFSKKAKTSSNAKERGKVQTMEGNKPDMLRQSQTHSIGSVPELTRDKKEDVVKKSGEIKKEARARDLPGSTNKVEEAVPAQAPLTVKMPVIEDDDTQLDKDVNLALNPGKHDRHISMDLGFDVKNDNSIFLEEPGFSASNSMDKAHDSSQSATGSTNSLSQPPGGSSNSLSEPSNDSKDSDHMKNKMHNTGTSEPLCTAEVHAIHESTSALHETEVTEPTYLSSETSVMEDNIETQTNGNMLEKQGKHSRSTSSEVKGSLHNGEPLSLDTSQDTPQATVEAGLSKTDNDDATSSFDLRRKKGRHSRITSLDLGDRKHLPEQDGRPQRKPRFSGSYSFDASNDSHASRIKVQPSMMAPSSSVPQFFPVESHYKISENSTWRNFGSNVYRDVSVSPPSLDEQLDMNSPAAISAVALQRAIEEASMIIQMAKEYLEREGQGSSNVRFKDTLKVGVTNDDQFADEMDEFRHYMTYEYCPPKDTEKQKLPFVEDTLKVKVTEDNQLSDEMNNSQQTMIPEISQPTYIEKEKLSVSERPSDLEIGQPSQVFEDVKKVSSDVSMVHDQNNTDEGHMNEAIIHNNGLPAGSVKESISLSERTSELENGLPSQISEDPKTFVKDDNMFQDGKKFVQDEIYLEERKPDVSKYTAERDRQGGPGGEWEAAKHLNQLISGVKNKFASFMAWQTDTERKDLKETEACKRSQEYEGGPDLVDEEHNEMKTNLINQDHAGCPGEHVEMEIGFLSETIDPCEDESFWSNTAEQETVENSVHLNPAAPLSPLESLVFYPFRKEEIHDPMDTTEEREGPNECTEIEFMNGQEVPSEMKFEQLQDTCEEQNREALVDTYIKENREVLDDASTNQIPEAFDDSCTKKHEVFDDTNIEEITEIVEEPCLQAGKEIHDSTEEDPMRSLVEECREDNTHDSLYSESTTETVDEHGNSDDSNIEETNEIVEEPYLQAGKEINDSTEEDPMRTLDEECREDHTLDSHYSESTMETVEEHGNSEECEKTKESENWQHDAQILEEIYLEGEIQATEETNDCQEIERGLSQTDEAAGQNHGCSNESMTYDTLNDHVEKVEVAEKEIFTGEDAFMKSEPCSIEVITEEMAKEASVVTEVEDEQTKIENDYIEDTAEQVTCFGIIEDDLGQTEHTCLSEAEEPFTNDQSSGGVEEMESSDDKHARTMEILKPSSETETKKEETTIFYDSFVELDEITEDLDDDDDQTFEVENSGLHGSQSDVHPREEEISANIMETESRDILENQTEHVHDSEESPDVGVIDTSSGEEVEKCGVDAVQKRRRWFDNGVKVGLAGRPSILEGDVTEVETDQEALDEFILAGSVEIHSDELDSGKQEVKQESGSVNTAESTPKRRRWSVKIGEEGLPVPPPLFQGVNVEEPQNVPHSKSEGSIYDLNAKSGETLNAPDVCVFLNGEKDKSSIDAAPKRKRWFTSGENIGPIPHPRSSGDATDHDSHVIGDIENQKCDDMSSTEDTEAEPCKMEAVNDRNVDEVNRKEKERMVVERAIREARERAFADARERARRDASEKPNVEVRQKVGAGAQEKAGKVPAESRGSSDKASIDAKLRAERAAVERATSEARERALQKALSEKSSHRSREQKNTSSDPSFQSSSSFSRADMSNKGEKHDAFDSESAQRRKARSERQSRTMEQPATALEEKNRRELLVQKEQAAKLQMMENSLDAEVKRWSAGKEGNLRLLLSTLQYILGPESGWQTVSLTDLMAATAVRKAYKKATLCVHPDKLQQRGATFQQKYVCERVFDLLKDAWSKLNPNER